MTKLITPTPSIPKSSDPYTLEKLIEGLDERGCLVLQVLLGQQCMHLLSKKHVDTVTKPSVLKPE